MPVINKFDGGLVTGIDPVYLNPDQSTILLDANIENIGLLSAKKPVEFTSGSRSFYQFPILDSEPEKFHVTSSNNMRSYAEFEGRLCYSDGGPVCQVTDGTFDSTLGDFKWNSLGVKKTDGVIKARVLMLSDLPGASAVVTRYSAPGTGFIISRIIRYRVVDTNGNMYTYDIDNNAGYASVAWTLPDSTYKVYRELISGFNEPSGKFVLVSPTGTNSIGFVDGLIPLTDNVEYITDILSRDYSGHRMSVHQGKSWTAPYNIVRSGDRISISVKGLTGIDTNNAWETLDLNKSILLDTEEAVVAIASTFVLADELYVQIRLGSTTEIYKADGSLVYETSVPMDEEFFKGTTVEHNGLLYMFSPSDGNVAIFDGTTIEYKTMDSFPFAKAEDTVYVPSGSLVYAVINNQHESNIRSISLPDLTVSYTGVERIETPLVRGLGGTSNSVLVDGDYALFPHHGGVIRFSPTTNDVIVSGRELTEAKACNKKGFASHGTFGHSIQSKSCSVDTRSAYVTYWSAPVVSLNSALEYLNERTLNGTYVYNASQRTPDGTSDGPLMDMESDPVTVYKGHIIIDTTGIIATEPLRIYRTGGYLTRFTMVEDVDITNNYIDKRDDVTIALGRNGSYDFADAPPEGLKFLTAHRGRLFGIVGSKVYWSEAGNANKWDELLSFVVMDRVVTGLASCVNGLLIFMKGRINLLQGDDRTSYTLRTTSVEKGTVDSYSIQEASNGAFFFSSDGLCFTDGAQIRELSYNILGPQQFDCIDSAATNRSYYALIKGYTNGTLTKYLKILRYDFGKDPVFSKLSGDAVSGLGTIFGRLAHHSNGVIYDTLAGTARKLNYRSGNITEGIPTMVKEWDRVRVAGRFVGKLIVYMEDKIAIEQTIDLKRDKLINYQFPKHANKGKTISFELVGTGFISSIEYSLTARKTVK